MRQLHERLLDEVMRERRRLSRRGLLSGMVKAAGGAALALAPPAMSSLTGVRLTTAAQEQVSDLDALTYALTLEHLQHAFYRDGLGQLSFGNDSRGQSIDQNLATIRDQEAEHVSALTQAIADLGGEAAAEASYDFGDAYTAPGAFLATAMALENVGVSAYAGVGQFLSDADLLMIAGAIAATEARHASYLNLLNGEIPFPAAFETPLSMDETLEIAGPFITA